MATETEIKTDTRPAAPEAGSEPIPPELPIKIGEPVGPEPASVEGAEPTPEPSWWSAVPDEDALWSHENAGRRLASAREEGLQTARQEMQPRVDATNGHLRELRKSLDGFWQSFDGIAEAAKGDPANFIPDMSPQLKELVEKHKDAFNALSGVNWDEGYRSALLGYRQGDQRVMGVLEAIVGNAEAAEHFTQRLRNVFEFGTKDEKFYADLRRALTESEVKAALAKEREKLEADIRAQVEEEARAKERERKGSPAAPAGGGGGGGGDTWRTKMEARNLHAKGKMRNAEMNAINADPSIPEM